MNELCRSFQESFGEAHISKELLDHAENCEVCQKFVRGQESLQSMLCEWKTPDVSSEFTLSVMSRLAEHAENRRSLKEIFMELFRVRFSIPLPVGVFATFLFIVSLLFNFLNWSDSHSEMKKEPHNQVVVTKNIPIPQTVHTTDSVIPFSPRWNGAGAFLLIPMVDLNPVWNLEMEEESNSQDESNKI